MLDSNQDEYDFMLENDQIFLTYNNYNNGSTKQIAGVCNKDKTVFGMMPHPERCFMNWQCPYSQSNDEFTPWYYMF